MDIGLYLRLVRIRGLEPPRLSAQAPQACVTTNSTISADIYFLSKAVNSRLKYIKLITHPKLTM